MVSENTYFTIHIIERELVMDPTFQKPITSAIEYFLFERVHMRKRFKLRSARLAREYGFYVPKM